MAEYKDVAIGSYFANQEGGTDDLPDNLRAVSYSSGRANKTVVFSNHGRGLSAHQVTVTSRGPSGELLGESVGSGPTRRDALRATDIGTRQEIRRRFSRG